MRDIITGYCDINVVLHNGRDATTELERVCTLATTEDEMIVCNPDKCKIHQKLLELQQEQSSATQAS